VLANSSGRTVNQNIGETTRRGAELGVDALWGGGFSARMAYTYIRAVVAQAYYTCVGAPCRPPATLTGRHSLCSTRQCAPSEPPVMTYVCTGYPEPRCIR
jgi:outer membrane receptor protein involved in Fe transport